MPAKTELPYGAALTISILGVAWGIFSPNLGLTAAVFICLAAMLLMTWRPGELPVLFLCLTSQWMEVSTPVFHANALGRVIEEMSEVETYRYAIQMGLAGLFAVSVGMRLALRGFNIVPEWKFRRETARMNIDTVFWYYIGLYLFSIFCQGLMWENPGLTQGLMAFFNLRWVFYILLAYITLFQRKKRYFIAFAFLMEMAVGMVSYFAEFRQPMVLLGMVYLSLGRRITFKRFIGMILIGTGMIMFGALWTCVKTEYRDYINEGTGAQAATIPVAERYSKVIELYRNIDTDKFGQGIEALAERISYVEFFAMVLHNVPREIPHENGLLVFSAVQHVLTPRVLNPNKPIVDQTGLTTKYTGIEFMENTSVNLGYMAEYYIDFGLIGLFVMTLLTGFVVGSIYRYFIGQKRVGLFNYILASVVILPFNNFGVNLVILFGTITMAFLIMSILLKVLVPFIERVLTSKERVIG
ncbi:MAG TPA: hypothetical protein VL404_02325 [Candidatus Eisenbacteria bacterium]|nr:hypothetical protein [Candidatus Eisenbacteria bacterium]